MADEAYIKRLQEGIRHNNSLIASNNSRISDLKASKSRYKARIRELERIRNNILRSFSGEVDNINERQRDFKRRLEKGVSSFSHTDELSAAVSRDAETVLQSEAHGAEMLNRISAEISRCEGEVSQADSRISSYEENTRQAKSANKRMNDAIREERSK